MFNSKMENKPFIGFTLIDLSEGISWKFRIAQAASTFTAEALAIDETPEIIEKLDIEQYLMIFLDLESMLKGISNMSAVSNTWHMAQNRKTGIMREKNTILLDARVLWSQS
jgi:hypothetical protein